MRRLIIISVLLLLVIGLAIWLWPSKPIVSSTPVSELKAQQSLPIVPVVPTPPIGEAKVQQPGGPYEPSDPRWKWWNEMEKKDRLFEWKMPINFYGKVVEYTTGEPIAGVEVTLVWNDLSQEGTSRQIVTTDEQGLFNLTGVNGKALSVHELKKEGYIRSRGDQSVFEYAGFWAENYYQPDPNKPVIFRMKKKGEVEPLVHWDTLYGLKPDGTLHYLDLKTGRKTMSGEAASDLMLQLTRTPSSNPDHPSWTLIIQGMGNTGLLESSEEFMFEAPASGYVNQVRVEQQGNAPDYQSQIYKNYFVRLSDGTFARIGTHVFSRYNDEAAIDIDLYLNPSGSRNLEFDPAKQIKR